MKADHEGRFGSPESIMLQKFEDQTESNRPTSAKTLARLYAVLNRDSSYDDVQELEEYVAKLRDTPLKLRRFLGAVSKRIVKMQNSNVVRYTDYGEKILISDLAGVLGMSPRSVYNMAEELAGYELGDTDFIETNAGPKEAVRIFNLKSGWPFWSDVVEFCEKANEPIEAFTEMLDFARLD